MADIVERLQAFNQNRLPTLVQLKYHRMRSNTFAFYRGTCHLFYEDWSHETTPSLLNDAPLAWICGDLHWQNMGSYKGDNRLVYFNINDFDETALAPFTWDFARLLTSFFVSARMLNIKINHVPALCNLFIDDYRRELEKRRIRSIEEDKARGIVRDLLFQAKTRTQKTFLDRYTTEVDGKRTLHIDGEKLTPISKEQRQTITAHLESWSQQQIHPHFYRVLDIAHRIAGIGSLGVERYTILVEGKGSPDHNYLLDLKAETTSSLQPYLITPQPHWSSEAARTTIVQQHVQGVTPALLNALQLDGGTYVLREMHADEDKISTELIQNKESRLEKLLSSIAQILAWNHLRASGWQGAATWSDLIQFVRNSRWQEQLIEYVQSYAEHVEQDYSTFCSAYDTGAFSPPHDHR
ncbi:DUF2252 domain-containing protein [Ktedonobacteria bacterium brp13]|nr:DUF2252 domain-containing protein [Ktedonobacteria bacterium brp13]